MDNELVERVARVLWDLSEAKVSRLQGMHPYKPDPWDSAPEFFKIAQRKEATAVLAELAGELEDAKPQVLEREWDYSLHTNPSAQAWAEAFDKMYPTCNVRHDVMIGWFANAMMAMHDYLNGGGPINGDHAQFLLDNDEAVSAALEGGAK